VTDTVIEKMVRMSMTSTSPLVATRIGSPTSALGVVAKPAMPACVPVRTAGLFMKGVQTLAVTARARAGSEMLGSEGTVM
jgi:hypothetical protein